MSELGLVIACLVGFGGLAFFAFWLAGVWQYACDEIATAFRNAWERLK